MYPVGPSKIMNFVIGLNVVWVFTESVIDLNDWQEIPLPSM